MASPLRTVHVLLAPEQITHLRLKAARGHTSVSALLRDMVEKDRLSEVRRERRQGETDGR
jgi:hypothetical protein